MPPLSELMQRSVVTIAPSAAVAEAARRMSEKTIGCLVVCTDSGVSGIVTERDLLYKVMAVGKDPATTPVSEVMVSPVVTGTPATPLEEAIRLMGEKRIRRLPVVESGRLVGIITSTDVILSTQRQIGNLAAELAETPWPPFWVTLGLLGGGLFLAGGGLLHYALLGSSYAGLAVVGLLTSGVASAVLVRSRRR